MNRIKTILIGYAGAGSQVVVTPLLMVVSRTWRGRFLGLMGVIGWIAFTSLVVGVWGEMEATGTPFLVVVISCPLLFVCILLVLVLRRRPVSGRGLIDSHFLKQWATKRYNGWDDVEDDYVWLLIQLVTRLDPWMPATERIETRNTTRRLLAEVRADRSYDRLPRVTYLLGFLPLRGRLDPLHLYSYRPEPRGPGERFGLFVFLHGHGTNYLVLLHALRPLADRLRVVLVAPTFGYGNWEAPGGVEAIGRATQFGLKTYAADPDRVFLAGLSQGGAGVSRAGAASPGLYAGLVFLSATMEPSVIGSEAFSTGWKGRPVLVIQGERDHNVPLRSVMSAVGRMEDSGAKVTTHIDPGAGHFLFFAKLDETLGQIAKWAEGVGS